MFFNWDANHMSIISRIFKTTLTVVLPFLSVGVSADPLQDKLAGTWVETIQFKDYPLVVLHFEGSKVKVENMYDKTFTVEYKISDVEKDQFLVSFEYTHKEKRGNGRIIDRTERPEFLFHMEDGVPILSDYLFEYDGRGLILGDEYLKKENYRKGFESRLKVKLDNQKPVPTYIENEEQKE